MNTGVLEIVQAFICFDLLRLMLRGCLLKEDNRWLQKYRLSVSIIGPTSKIRKDYLKIILKHIAQQPHEL
jgi:hypothetical protein